MLFFGRRWGWGIHNITAVHVNTWQAKSCPSSRRCPPTNPPGQPTRKKTVRMEPLVLYPPPGFKWTEANAEWDNPFGVMYIAHVSSK